MLRQNSGKEGFFLICYHIKQLLLLALPCGYAEGGRCWSVVQSALHNSPAQLFRVCAHPARIWKEVMKHPETTVFIRASLTDIKIIFIKKGFLMNNKRFIQPQTLNILGDTQNTTSHTSVPQSAGSDSGSTQSRWERFKTKVKNVWNVILSVAEDIKDNIMPIVAGAGHFLAAWAVFCNRHRSNNQKERQTAWA